MTQKELKFFKDFLLEREQNILENLQINSKEIEALHNSAPSDSVDFSSIETNSAIDKAISSNLRQELEDIKLSLSKIDKNSFGICENCDEEIDIARLKIKPHAKYCFACRELIEKENQ